MRDLATAMVKREPSVGIETAARLLAQADALLIPKQETIEEPKSATRKT